MRKLKVVISGESGRVGLELKKILSSHKRAEFYFGVSRKTEDRYAQIKKETHQTNGLVVIDFSTPKGMRQALSVCSKMNLPFVSGTTGLSLSDMKALKKAGRKIPVLWAPNMSMGINLLLKIIGSIGKNFTEYDLLIEDKHHRHKKDMPSGTAKLIQTEIKAASGGATPQIQSARGGGLVGTHAIWLMGEEEFLTIEHTAISRAVFAKGAVESALWLSQQKAGLYSFQDFLKARAAGVT